jgi:hypothetical protein
MESPTIRDAPLITWIFVMANPSLLIKKPEPKALRLPSEPILTISKMPAPDERAFPRAIADGNHVIEGLVSELIYVLRAVIRNINAKFIHNGNRFRPYASRSCASAFNFKAVSSIMPKQPFGHLAAS